MLSNDSNLGNTLRDLPLVQNEKKISLLKLIYKIDCFVEDSNHKVNVYVLLINVYKQDSWQGFWAHTFLSSIWLKGILVHIVAEEQYDYLNEREQDL